MEKISKNTEQQNQIGSGEMPKNTKRQNRVDLEEIMRKRLPTFQDWLYVGEQEIMKVYFNDLLDPVPFAAPETSDPCTASEAEPNTAEASTVHSVPEVSSVSDTPAVPAAPEAHDTPDAPKDSDASDTPATSDTSNDPPAKKTVLDDDEYFQNRIPADVFENASSNIVIKRIYMVEHGTWNTMQIGVSLAQITYYRPNSQYTLRDRGWF